MLKNRKNKWLIIIAVVVLLAVVLSLPPVWSRVVYHSRAAYTSIKYWIKPPSEAVFVPSTEKENAVATQNAASGSNDRPTTEPATIQTQSALEPTFAPTIPLPSSVLLRGITCEAQLWNNCGPATLSMYLSYYDWEKNQITVASVLKPNERDLNVMPYELVDFVNENTEQRALWRNGGDPQTIKALLNAGFPVMIEKSFEPYNIRNDGWLGHYNLVVGYDDKKQVFTVHDSYLLTYAPWGGRIEPDQYDTFIGFDYYYNKLDQDWRSFNYVFIVVYPPEKEIDVLNALGPHTTEEGACRIAYDRAIQETTSLPDVRDKFFAWFNAGTSLVCLKDYSGAAAAYDTAFSIYPEIKQEDRPYRLLWYADGPYAAYYYSGRYQDVIDLADQTLNNMSEPLLEESYYWKALSYNALGDTDKAIANLKTSLKCHPGYAPSLIMLEKLGVTP
jgi:hypothetical protein